MIYCDLYLLTWRLADFLCSILHQWHADLRSLTYFFPCKSGIHSIQLRFEYRVNIYSINVILIHSVCCDDQPAHRIRADEISVKLMKIKITWKKL